MKRFHRLASRALGLLMPAAMITLAACNEKSDSSTSYEPSSSVAISSFRLRPDTKVMANLDSVFFSIDLEHGVIFNADSLPVGTDVTRLVPVIVYPSNISNATLQSIGGKYEETVNYKKNPTDSVDFSGDVLFTLVAEDGKTSATYRLKVNVHKSDPDLMMWDNLAVRDLPSDESNPADQRTVSYNDRTLSFIREKSGRLTVAYCDNLFKGNWTKAGFEPGFDIDLRTITSSGKALYALSTDGSLYESTDAATWNATGKKWISVIGGYSDWVLGLRLDENGRILHTSWPEGEFAETEADPAFPIKDASNFTLFFNKWAPHPVGTLFGGETLDGNLTSATWAFDGTSWAILSEGKTPALRGATVVPYFGYLQSSALWIQTEYTTWFLTGGVDKDGKVNKTTYISYDYGVNWHQGDASLQLPESLKPLYNADQIVQSTPMSASLADAWTKVASRPSGMYKKLPYTVDGMTISWDCPYIFLFGGYTEGGGFNPTIRRGVLTRLTFAPII